MGYVPGAAGPGTHEPGGVDLKSSQGFVPAIRSLGICYIQGHGMERDVDEARRWLKRAAAAGDAKSIEELEKLNA